MCPIGLCVVKSDGCQINGIAEQEFLRKTPQMVVDQREGAVECEGYWDTGQGLINGGRLTWAMRDTRG